MNRYHAVLQGAPARHLIARRIAADAGFRSLDDEALWRHHDRLMAKFHEQIDGVHDASFVADSSLLDVKIELAERMLKACNFCGRCCRLDRHEGPGACGVDATSHVSSEFLHMGEEPELIPSHTIFFEGCNFACAYCQNWEIARRISGPPVDAGRMCRLIEHRHRQGSANVNFVGGDPAPHLHTVLKIIRCIESNIPTIWNSNMYLSPETLQLLDGAIDVYLADFRYGDDGHALRYSGIKNYWEVTTRAFLEAKRQADVLVRLLVLPGHVECCARPIIEWCARNLGSDVRFNLMFQYHPEYRAAEFPEINRHLTGREIRLAMEIAREAGLTNLV